MTNERPAWRVNRVTLTIPADTLAALQYRAKNEGRTTSKLASLLLARALQEFPETIR